MADRKRKQFHRCCCRQCKSRRHPEVAEYHRSIKRVMSELDERSRRLFAGLLARQFGRGGKQLVLEITGLSRMTIDRGLRECQDGELPFSGVLSEQIVSQAMNAVGIHGMDTIYTPLVTLWVFLSQVLSQDHSCRAAVARLISHRISQGQSPCSPETGAYCQARKQLPEKFFSEVARQTGDALDKNVAPDWRWKGRRVLAFDDSTVSMPDTPANQSAYPQPESQKPGVGFPRARIAAVFSLSCGAALDLGFCRYAGKGQSELGLLRTLWDKFRPGDVVLTDRRMCTWTEMVMLKQRGIDSVTRLNINRSADFKSGKRLGKGDYIVVWEKPTKPRSIDRKTFDSLPYLLKVRELLVHVEQPGFRSKTIIVVTTLLNEDITKDELAQLYRARWNVELDLRSSESLLVLYEQLLDAVASHRVADRPDRFEPRKKKRRDGKYDLLTKPRREAKADILKGLSKI